MKLFNTFYRAVNKRDFATNLAVGITMLIVIGCGGATVGTVIGGALNGLSRHIVTSQRPGTHIFPGKSNRPFIAAFFQAASLAPSQLQQSYDSVCNFSPGLVESVPQGSLIPLAMATESSNCNSFSGPQVNSGKETVFDGQLGTLVVQGKTESGASFQCRDIQTTMEVPDNSFSRAYYDPSSNTVDVFNSANGVLSKVPFACPNIGSPTDQPVSLEAQWSKI